MNMYVCQWRRRKCESLPQATFLQSSCGLQTHNFKCEDKQSHCSGLTHSESHSHTRRPSRLQLGEQIISISTAAPPRPATGRCSRLDKRIEASVPPCFIKYTGIKMIRCRHFKAGLSEGQTNTTLEILIELFGWRIQSNCQRIQVVVDVMSVLDSTCIFIGIEKMTWVKFFFILWHTSQMFSW